MKNMEILCDWLYSDLDCLLDEAQTDLKEGAVEESFPRILTRMMQITDVLRNISKIETNSDYHELCSFRERVKEERKKVRNNEESRCPQNT